MVEHIAKLLRPISVRDVKLEFFLYSIIETKKIDFYFRLSNFKYNGLKRASLPLHASTGVSDKKLMRTTGYAERIHICAEDKGFILTCQYSVIHLFLK